MITSNLLKTVFAKSAFSFPDNLFQHKTSLPNSHNAIVKIIAARASVGKSEDPPSYKFASDELGNRFYWFVVHK